MLVHIGLELHRGDVLASAAHRVLQPIDEVVPTSLVAHHAVTGVEPAIAPRLRRLLGHSEVAHHHPPRLIGPHEQLTDLAGRDLVVVLVGDSDLVTRRDPFSGRLPIGRHVRAGIERGAHLGVAEIRAHHHPEPPLEVLDAGHDRRASDVAQGVVEVVGLRRLVEQPVHHRRNQRRDRAAVGADVVPEALGLE